MKERRTDGTGGGWVFMLEGDGFTLLLIVRRLVCCLFHSFYRHNGGMFFDSESVGRQVEPRYHTEMIMRCMAITSKEGNPGSRKGR